MDSDQSMESDRRAKAGAQDLLSEIKRQEQEVRFLAARVALTASRVRGSLAIPLVDWRWLQGESVRLSAISLRFQESLEGLVNDAPSLRLVQELAQAIQLFPQGQAFSQEQALAVIAATQVLREKDNQAGK